MQLNAAGDRRLEDRVAVVTGAGTRARHRQGDLPALAAEGARVAVLDLDAAGAQQVAAEITGGGRHGHRHRLRRARPGRLRGRGGPRHRRVGRPRRHPREQRGLARRRRLAAVRRVDRRGVGPDARRQSARDVVLRPRLRAVHEGGRLRQDRQRHVVHLLGGRRRLHPLHLEQGRRDRLHPRPRARAGSVRHPRQRARARLHHDRRADRARGGAPRAPGGDARAARARARRGSRRTSPARPSSSRRRTATS